MKNHISLLVLLISSFIAQAQKPVFTSAKVNAATVYFNAAELSQNISLNLPAGPSEIVVKNIANRLDQNTIQIATPPSLMVLSTQFTQNYISEYEIDESNPSIKKVRDSIKLVEKEIASIKIEKLSNSKTIELLDKNQQVSGTNGLNTAEFIKMVDYYKSKRSELSKAIDLLTEKETLWNKKLTALNSKLEFNTSNEDKISNGKLILQVMNEKAGNITIGINYITNNASWSPFYDLRTENIDAPINMIYNARIVQNTGVDWKKVKLTLSSGTPNQNNIVPDLQTWFLSYYDKDIEYNNRTAKANISMSYAPPPSSMEMDVAELREDISPSYKNATINNYTNINENQLNVSFDIDIPYDILSNGKVHSVALKTLSLPATYKYFSAPKIDNDAFLLAEISDYSKYNLLPGQANVIFEGLYIGKIFINPNQTEESLPLSMGRDRKISVSREKIVDKSGTKFLSSYKEQVFTYDIIVRNNKKEKIELKLEDQYPITTNNDITIELLESSGAKVNKETGILTWNIKLSGNETKKIRLSYKVKSPKDLIINNLY